MDRRNFIRNVAATVPAASLTLEAATSKETASVKFSVEGYTCITCAVGLETLLKLEKGVVRASASYPGKSAEVGYDSHLTSEKALVDFIGQCGFKARKV